MSSSKPTRRAVLLAPLALVACGFTPAYGPGGGAAGLRGRIRAAEPKETDEFHLVRSLEDRLGRPGAGAFDLTYSLTTTVEGAGITPSNAITRFSLVGFADWTLLPAGGGEVLAKGRAEGFSSWSATGNTISGLSAEDDARVRLMRILADQIVSQLLLAAPRLPT